MTVTPKILKRAVLTLFETEAKIHDDEDCVVFNVKCGDYYTFATLKLFTSFPHETRPIQALGISFVMTDTEGFPINLQRHDYALTTAVCLELQHHIDWAILSPLEMPDQSVEVTLYRSIQTTTADIELALEEELGSELLSSIVHLQKECEYIAPVLQHFATAEKFDLGLIDVMLQPKPKEQAHS